MTRRAAAARFGEVVALDAQRLSTCRVRAITIGTNAVYRPARTGNPAILARMRSALG